MKALLLIVHDRARRDFGRTISGQVVLTIVCGLSAETH